jgi:hypothetical protein
VLASLVLRVKPAREHDGVVSRPAVDRWAEPAVGIDDPDPVVAIAGVGVVDASFLARWYDGYRIVISEVTATYGDDRLPG